MCALKSIQNLCRDGMSAAGAGNFAGAGFLLRQALRQAGAIASPVLEAKILNSLGVVSLMRGRGAEAAPHLALALEKVERRVGKNNKLYAVIESNLLQAEKEKKPL